MRTEGFAWLALLLVWAGAGCRSEPAASGAAEPLATRGPIAVLDAFAPEPVTPDVAALYMTLRNSGDRPDRVMEVSVDVAARAELHGQVETGDMVRMEQVMTVDLPPGTTVALAPGGLHVMLLDVSAYAVGDSLLVLVTLEGNGQLAFHVPVIPYADVAQRANHGAALTSHD